MRAFTTSVSFRVFLQHRGFSSKGPLLKALVGIAPSVSCSSSVATTAHDDSVRAWPLCSLRRLHDAADIFVHLAGAMVCIFVWLWHFTPAAARLPGAMGFGWFFKFLTFWGWTLQTLQYCYCALFSVTTPVRRTPAVPARSCMLQ